MLLKRDRTSDQSEEVNHLGLVHFLCVLIPLWVPWSFKFEKRQRRMVLAFEDEGVLWFWGQWRKRMKDFEDLKDKGVRERIWEGFRRGKLRRKAHKKWRGLSMTKEWSKKWLFKMNWAKRLRIGLMDSVNLQIWKIVKIQGKIQENIQDHQKISKIPKKIW